MPNNLFPTRVLITFMQSWGTNTPYKRGASISSAAGVLELSSAQGDGNHSWASARSASGTWEDSNGSPQNAEYGQLVSSLSLRPSRLFFTNFGSLQRTPHSAGFPRVVRSTSREFVIILGKVTFT